MALQKFIDIFGGHKSLTLCQNLAIAHTESPIEGVDITPYQAHKFLIDNPEDSAQYDYKKSDWLELRAELSKFIRDNKSDRNYLHNQICEILMQLADVASYFFSTEEKDVGESVNKLFNCIVETYLKATANHSTATYEDILSSYEATRKWSRESLQTIARIGVALRKFGNLLQGCIYANNLNNAVSHYQKFCGVILAPEFTNSSIVDATYWTKTYTKKICKQKKEEDSTNAPLFSTLSIAQLKSAIDEGIINKDGILKKPVSELVRHFYEKGLFLPLTKKAFKPIDGILRTKKGECISAQRLSRAATDLQKNCYIDRDHRRMRNKHTAGKDK
ncbi:MAG: hypothetical protein II344_01350 [Bacteroidales bacterium]|jgi:hypothetical protein|nr:hypothetical protein [Bacteroidales bacterium]